jgi:hypothetical protein
MAALLVMAVFVLGSVALVSNIKRGNADRDKICRVASLNNTTISKLLLLARKNAEVSLKGDPVRLRASQKFYREALGLLKPVDCRKL